MLIVTADMPGWIGLENSASSAVRQRLEGNERGRGQGEPPLVVNPVVDDEDAVVGQELCLPHTIGSAEMSPGANHSPPGEITT